ncbi:MAG: Na/Pi symporter [Gammaproteobacteria bacterium]
MFALAGAFIGGVGLFLLGMWLMTEGLRLSAGEALRHVLVSGTRTPARGLLAGFGLTAAVQSSSAVTVASVGFVNAGLLTLTQAVRVIYGSNIGTTMTGWIVAVTGIEVRLDTYALPMLGLGMLIRLTGAESKRAAWGQALVGFAVFLIGIQSLKASFLVLAGQVDFSVLPTSGWSAGMLYFGIGLVLTFLVQSSSATTAIAISAASAGIVPVPLAALVIIGADLGTSTTAALAALGATANARRAALSHVVLNLVTVVFAVVMLSPLLIGSAILQDLLWLPDDPGITLAVFSTTFNVAGVVLMLPMTGAMVGWLEQRFVSGEEDVQRPRHLDATLLEVPTLALRGLLLELHRMGRLCVSLIADAADCSAGEMVALRQRGVAINVLGERIRDYVGRMNRRGLPPDVADTLAPLLRALQHYEESVGLILAGTRPDDPGFPGYAALRQHFSKGLRAALEIADTADGDFDLPRLVQAEADATRIYESLKAQLLEAAADGRLDLPAMDSHMRDAARLKRALERVVKATRRLAPFRPLVDGMRHGT